MQLVCSSFISAFEAEGFYFQLGVIEKERTFCKKSSKASPCHFPFYNDDESYLSNQFDITFITCKSTNRFSSLFLCSQGKKKKIPRRNAVTTTGPTQDVAINYLLNCKTTGVLFIDIFIFKIMP